MNNISTFLEFIERFKEVYDQEWLLRCLYSKETLFKYKQLYYPESLFLGVFNSVNIIGAGGSLNGFVFTTIKGELELIEKTRKKREFFYEFDVIKNLHKLKDYRNLDDIEWQETEEKADIISMFRLDEVKIYGGYRTERGFTTIQYFNDNLNLGKGHLGQHLIDQNYRRLFFYECIHEELDEKRNQAITNNPSFTDSPFFQLNNKVDTIERIIKNVFSDDWLNNKYVKYRSIEEKIKSLQVNNENFRNKFKLIENRKDFTISLIYYGNTQSLVLEIY